MKYNPEIHHRRSIRLKGYDYSQEGLYFITICTKDRECIFGEVVNTYVGAGFSCPKMKLNTIGKIVKGEILKLSEKYQNIECNEYIIMPNHIHIVIKIKNIKSYCQKGGKTPPVHKVSLGNIIGYFKYITTKLYNDILKIKNECYIKLWHRNYYENIIRNEEAYLKVLEYIKTNPLKWEDDKYFKNEKGE